jgi:polar amino acid transport system substrate-binding protein
MRHILPVLILAALVLTGCADAPRAGAQPATDRLEQLRTAGTVRIGVKTDAPPFGYLMAGQNAGFDVELAQALAAQMGIAEVVFVPVTSDNRGDKLVAGEVDLVVASMTMTRYREKKVDFSIPYFQDGQAIVVPAASPISTYQDTAGRKVAAVKGSSSAFYMKQVCPDAVVVPVEGTAGLRAALTAGTVDAITSDSLILAGLLRQLPAGAYRFAGPRFTTEPYAIAVPENQSKLRKAVNHALCALWESGRYQEIHATWFGPGAPYASNLSFAIPVYPK